jgi:hypothetical protein
MEPDQLPHVVRIAAHVHIEAANGSPIDEATAVAINRNTSDLGLCAASAELTEAGLRGGRVFLSYDEAHKDFWAAAEIESPAPVGDDLLEFVKEEANGDWNDGVTASFFEYLGSRLGLAVHASWRDPMTVSQFQGPRWKCAPWSALSRACWRGHLEEARAALDAGEDVNTSPEGLPILHGAIISGHVEIARLLIDHGADVRRSDELAVERDPLRSCVTHDHPRGSDVVIARMLLERGANPLSCPGDSPLDVARRRKWDSMVRLLEEFVTPSPGRRLRAGERVRVCTGPFTGMWGSVEQEVMSTDAAISAKVRIEVFGQQIVIDVSSSELYPLL